MHRITPAQSGFRAYSGGGGRLILDEVDDSKNMQEAKGTGMKGEGFEGAEAPQNYGFTSANAPADKDKDGNITDGAEGFWSFIGGNRSFPVATGMDDRRHRLKNLVQDAAKGATAMFGLKEWGQQFLNTDTGMFMTGNTEKKMRFQLVDNQNGKKQQQQPGQQAGNLKFKSKSGVEFDIEVVPLADGGGGSGGGGGTAGNGGSKPTGQKTLHKEDSSTYVDMTKDAVHSVRGKGNVKIEDSATHTYHEDTTTSTRCDDSHVHIRKGEMKIWVDKGGCHSTVPITITDCSDGGASSTLSGAATPTDVTSASPASAVQPAVFTSEQPKARLRFWMVRHVNAMGVDNANVVGMDFTALPTNVAIVEWKAGVGEIEYFNLPRLRQNFSDVTPYCPFFQQFMTRLTGITLTQAQKIQCDLIDVLYEAKRQMPYHYPVAAGDYSWDATDDVIAAMSTTTIPTLIGYNTGTSDSTTVGKINALIDQINAWIVNPGNNLTFEIGNNVVNGVNVTVVDGINNQVSSNIVAPFHSFTYYFNNTVLGGGTDPLTGPNTLNGKLQSGGTANSAFPGLNGNIATAADTMNGTAIGQISGITANPFSSFPHQGITPDPSIPPIQWTPSGAASSVNLTATEMSGLMSGIANRRASLLNARITKKNTVNALTTVAAVIGYNVTTGWPS